MVNDKTSGPDPAREQRALLRMIGILALLLGVGGAGIVYWIGTRSADATEDSLLTGYSEARSRAESRQMGLLFGKSGVLIDDLWDDLKRPGTQATLIAGVSALIASGCFYLARPLDSEDETR